MKILFSAAEASSDVHGAVLLKELRQLLLTRGCRLEAFGIGGPRLQKEGLEITYPSSELLAMGSSEVIARLPKILRGLRIITQTAAQKKPDLAVVIDYPDFHIRLGRRLKKLGIPVIYFIPPKVWVWRQSRVQVLKQTFEKLFCIFPFEEKFYREKGVDATYVGNPLLEELPFDLSRDEARAALGLGLEKKYVVLMPGSRPSELKRHIPLMLKAAQSTSAQCGFDVLMPLPTTCDLSEVRSLIATAQNELGKFGFEVKLFQGRSAEALVAADAGIIKSGTSTLEAALLGCPHVITYDPSPLTAFVFQKYVRRGYLGPVGMVNLIRGWKEGDPYLVPEYLCEQATPKNLERELTSLLTEPDRSMRMKQDFALLKAELQAGLSSQGGSPSRQCATLMVDLLAQKGLLPS